MIEIKACSHDRNTQIFPLFLKHKAYGLNIEAESTPNVSGKLFSNLANTLGLQTVTHCEGHGKDAELTPLKLFDYAYAILYSPAYRKRYFEFLRSDFPRLPLTPRLDLFRALAALGGDLVALHLLESPQLDHLITKFIGDPKQEIEKIAFTVGRVSDAAPSVEATSRRFSVTGRDAASTTAAPATGTVWIDKTQTTGFQGVPDNVWNFHIGGYQVCEKWLKDRKGRTLSKDDMAHYQKIVVALTETIRLMSEIDKVIEAHGGWPGAFASTTAQSEREKPADLPMAAEGRASYSTVRAEDSGTMRNRDEAD